jgi:hypothetical protein
MQDFVHHLENLFVRERPGYFMPHLDIGFNCCAPVPHMNHPVLKFSCRWFSHVMLRVSFLCTVLGLQDRGLEVDTPKKVSDTPY